VKSAKIAGLGKCLPARVLTNADLEKIVETSDEWIKTRTGINTRRIVEAGTGASVLGARAAEQALERAGIKPSEVELIIAATISGDAKFPSTACYIQDILGAKNAACFDVSAACAGYVYALAAAWQFINGGLYKKVLVVGTEVLSSVTDWKDRSTCVLFGDGAGAAVLVESDQESFLSAYLGGDGSHADILNIPAGGSRKPFSEETLKDRGQYIKMKGNELFKIAVRVMVDAAIKALDKAGLKLEDVSLFIPHQANQRIISGVAQRLKVSEDKIYLNIARYGNMSSASTAVALTEAWEDGRIKKDDIVVLDAFGGGLVWGSCVIRWV